MTAINESDELSDKFFNEFSSYRYTKIGGYASYIQSPCSNGYIFKKDGEWYISWDCY